MADILIKNGRVIDPKNGVDAVCDVLVADGAITAVGKDITESAHETIDASGLIVTPGLVDMHVHFREPGREDQETIETGSQAALAGGVTSVLVMPNTATVADNQSVIEFIKSRAREAGLINVYPSGAITKGEKGELLAEMNELKKSGAIAVTDDGLDVQDEGLLKRAMEYAKTIDMLIMSHCEVDALVEDGVMHEGWVSTQLGLAGIPAIAEDLAAYKSVMLAEDTGARFHLLHASTAGAVRAVREAKARGAAHITGEASAQHFSLTDEECVGYNTNAKMYPPLRSADHVAAIVAGLADGTLDVISTDHAPHIEPDKIKPFNDAARGTVGLETSFAVMYTYLVAQKKLSLADGIRKMSVAPAEVLRIDKGHLSTGAVADIALFDPAQQWTVDPKQFFSKGKNSAFKGKMLTGKAVATIVGGKVKYRDGKIL